VSHTLINDFHDYVEAKYKNGYKVPKARREKSQKYDILLAQDHESFFFCFKFSVVFFAVAMTVKR
jgi:hypothetical protein